MPLFKGWKISPGAELCQCRMDSHTEGYLKEKRKGAKHSAMRQFGEVSGITRNISIKQ